MKEMRGARLTRRQSQILWIMKIGVKERASEKKLRPISIHAKTRMSEGEGKKEFFYFERKEKNFRQPRADFFL
jgi:hypothetical protein